MPRKPDRKSNGPSAIQAKQRELDKEAEQLKAQLSQTQEFLAKVPAIKEEVQRKQQQAIYDRFNRPARAKGAVDFQLRYDGPKKSPPPRRLRRERTWTPLVTFVLAIIFAIVAWFTWRSLWQG